MAIRDRDDDGLDRRDPERERPGEVLDEDADEPLQRAVDRPVDRHRPDLLAGLVDVRQVEPLGQHRQVGLDRRHLPLAPEGVVDVDVDLRRVEGAVFRFDLVGHPGLVEGLLHLGLGARPESRVADRLVGLRREGEAGLEPEPAVDLLDEVEEAGHRRGRHRSHLDKVEASLLRHLESLRCSRRSGSGTRGMTASETCK